jgi:hypothetical protein
MSCNLAYTGTKASNKMHANDRTSTIFNALLKVIVDFITKLIFAAVVKLLREYGAGAEINSQV